MNSIANRLGSFLLKKTVGEYIKGDVGNSFKIESSGVSLNLSDVEFQEQFINETYFGPLPVRLQQARCADFQVVFPFNGPPSISSAGVELTLELKNSSSEHNVKEEKPAVPPQRVEPDESYPWEDTPDTPSPKNEPVPKEEGGGFGLAEERAAAQRLIEARVRGTSISMKHVTLRICCEGDEGHICVLLHIPELNIVDATVNPDSTALIKELIMKTMVLQIFEGDFESTKIQQTTMYSKTGFSPFQTCTGSEPGVEGDAAVLIASNTILSTEVGKGVSAKFIIPTMPDSHGRKAFRFECRFQGLVGTVNPHQMGLLSKFGRSVGIALRMSGDSAEEVPATQESMELFGRITVSSLRLCLPLQDPSPSALESAWSSFFERLDGAGGHDLDCTALGPCLTLVARSTDLNFSHGEELGKETKETKVGLSTTLSVFFSGQQTEILQTTGIDPEVYISWRSYVDNGKENTALDVKIKTVKIDIATAHLSMLTTYVSTIRGKIQSHDAEDFFFDGKSSVCVDESHRKVRYSSSVSVEKVVVDVCFPVKDSTREQFLRCGVLTSLWEEVTSKDQFIPVSLRVELVDCGVELTGETGYSADGRLCVFDDAQEESFEFSINEIDLSLVKYGRVDKIISIFGQGGDGTLRRNSIKFCTMKCDLQSEDIKFCSSDEAAQLERETNVQTCADFIIDISFSSAIIHILRKHHYYLLNWMAKELVASITTEGLTTTIGRSESNFTTMSSFSLRSSGKSEQIVAVHIRIDEVSGDIYMPKSYTTEEGQFHSQRCSEDVDLSEHQRKYHVNLKPMIMDFFKIQHQNLLLVSVKAIDIEFSEKTGPEDTQVKRILKRFPLVKASPLARPSKPEGEVKWEVPNRRYGLFVCATYHQPTITRDDYTAKIAIDRCLLYHSASPNKENWVIRIMDFLDDAIPERSRIPTIQILKDEVSSTQSTTELRLQFSSIIIHYIPGPVSTVHGSSILLLEKVVVDTNIIRGVSQTDVQLKFDRVELLTHSNMSCDLLKTSVLFHSLQEEYGVEYPKAPPIALFGASGNGIVSDVTLVGFAHVGSIEPSGKGVGINIKICVTPATMNPTRPFEVVVSDGRISISSASDAMHHFTSMFVEYMTGGKPEEISPIATPDVYSSSNDYSGVLTDALRTHDARFMSLPPIGLDYAEDPNDPNELLSARSSFSSRSESTPRQGAQSNGWKIEPMIVHNHFAIPSGTPPSASRAPCPIDDEVFSAKDIHFSVPRDNNNADDERHLVDPEMELVMTFDGGEEDEFMNSPAVSLDNPSRQDNESPFELENALDYDHFKTNVQQCLGFSVDTTLPSDMPTPEISVCMGNIDIILNLYGGKDLVSGYEVEKNHQGHVYRGELDRIPGRADKVRVQINVENFGLQMDFFPLGAEKDFRVVAAINKFSMVDKICDSAINTMVSSQYEMCQSPMFTVELVSVRPDTRNVAWSELKLDVHIQPLRLVIDQAALEFLIEYATFPGTSKTATPKHGPARSPVRPDSTVGFSGVTSNNSTPLLVPTQSKDSQKPYFQSLSISDLSVIVDYYPRKFDVSKVVLERDFIELRNICSLNASRAFLPRISVGGFRADQVLVKLKEKYSAYLGTSDLIIFLCGVQFIRPLANVAGGVSGIVMVPLQQYREDRSVLRGIRQGLAQFAQTLAVESCDATASVSSYAKSVLGSTVSAIEGKRHAGTVFRKRPGTAQEGIMQGLQSLIESLTTASNILRSIPKSSPGNNESVILRTARSIPSITIQPVLGALSMVASTLTGVSNQIQPKKRNESEKYFK